MGKKRYSLTLTQEKVEQFQELAKSIGMPPSIMSKICDDAITSMSEVFKRAKERGNFQMSDLFTLLGEMLQEDHDQLVEEEKAHDEKRKAKIKARS